MTAVARLLHSTRPRLVASETIARTYAEYPRETSTDVFWSEGEPLYTISDVQLRNIAREIAGQDRKMYAKVYTAMHEGLRK